MACSLEKKGHLRIRMGDLRVKVSESRNKYSLDLGIARKEMKSKVGLVTIRVKVLRESWRN